MKKKKKRVVLRNIQPVSYLFLFFLKSLRGSCFATNCSNYLQDGLFRCFVCCDRNSALHHMKTKTDENQNGQTICKSSLVTWPPCQNKTTCTGKANDTIKALLLKKQDSRRSPIKTMGLVSAVPRGRAL